MQENPVFGGKSRAPSCDSLPNQVSNALMTELILNLRQRILYGGATLGVFILSFHY